MNILPRRYSDTVVYRPLPLHLAPLQLAHPTMANYERLYLSNVRPTLKRQASLEFFPAELAKHFSNPEEDVRSDLKLCDPLALDSNQFVKRDEVEKDFENLSSKLNREYENAIVEDHRRHEHKENKHTSLELMSLLKKFNLDNDKIPRKASSLHSMGASKPLPDSSTCEEVFSTLDQNNEGELDIKKLSKGISAITGLFLSDKLLCALRANFSKNPHCVDLEDFTKIVPFVSAIKTIFDEIHFSTKPISAELVAQLVNEHSGSAKVLSNYVTKKIKTEKSLTLEEFALNVIRLRKLQSSGPKIVEQLRDESEPLLEHSNNKLELRDTINCDVVLC